MDLSIFPKSRFREILAKSDKYLAIIQSDWVQRIQRSGSMSNTTLSGVELTLSAKGLGNLPKNVYENDFTFIVGESHYHCPSFLASFLSPRICHLQKKDPTLREFSIETKDPTYLFEKLLEVCYGSSFRVCENVPFFKSIFCELSNRELYEQIYGKSSDDLTILNVDRLQFLFSANESCEREIEDMKLIRKQFLHSHVKFFHQSFQMFPFDWKMKNHFIN
jgi:hypothetical protein